MRAIAILVIVAYHAGLPGFPGGFIGVDIFFVISGFLITRNLIDESTNTTQSCCLDSGPGGSDVWYRHWPS
jgi:peptidoglycan/LPS O-acetylase OafA/YrhL